MVIEKWKFDWSKLSLADIRRFSEGDTSPLFVINLLDRVTVGGAGHLDAQEFESLMQAFGAAFTAEMQTIAILNEASQAARDAWGQEAHDG